MAEKRRNSIDAGRTGRHVRTEHALGKYQHIRSVRGAIIVQISAAARDIRHRTRGPAFEPSRPLEAQADWAAHAAFMNGLVRDGSVILGGPLEGTADVLLVMRAASADDARDRLAADPWTVQDLLRVSWISRWALRLGSLD